MAKDKNSGGQQHLGAGAGLATTSATLGLSGDDAELAALFGGGDLGDIDDGLGEVGAEDVKIALKVWNMKGIDPVTKKKIPEDVFFDTVTETTAETLDLVFLALNKKNEWRQFVEAEKKSVIHCRSNDRITGEMTETHERRACATCPDAKWTRDAAGKPTRHCGPVYSVAALEVASKQLCVLRFKKTSLAAIRSHLNKHHIGRRIENGKRSNWPLFAYQVRARLRMDDGGIYSLIEIEKIGNVTKELLAEALEAKAFYLSVQQTVERQLAEKDLEAGGESGGGDTSFNPNDFVDAEGTAAGGAQPSFPHG